MTVYEKLENDTSSREAKPLNHWLLIRKMKCYTFLPFVLFILFYISNFFDNSFNGLCGSMGVFRSIPPKLEH